MGFVNTYNEFLIEKLSKSDREKLDDSDFVFPERRAWPIHTKKQAQIALVWATWPQNKKIKDTIVKKVISRYPELNNYGAAK